MLVSLVLLLPTHHLHLKSKPWKHMRTHIITSCYHFISFIHIPISFIYSTWGPHDTHCNHMSTCRLAHSGNPEMRRECDTSISEWQTVAEAANGTLIRVRQRRTALGYSDNVLLPWLEKLADQSGYLESSKLKIKNVWQFYHGSPWLKQPGNKSQTYLVIKLLVPVWLLRNMSQCFKKQ